MQSEMRIDLWQQQHQHHHRHHFDLAVAVEEEEEAAAATKALQSVSPCLLAQEYHSAA